MSLNLNIASHVAAPAVADVAVKIRVRAPSSGKSPQSMCRKQLFEAIVN